MKPIGWIFTGVVAAGATYVSITTENDQIAIISGLIGTVSWLLFAFYSLSITIYDANGSPQTDRYPAAAAWGLVMASPNLYIALTGPLEIVHNRDQVREEVQ